MGLLPRGSAIAAVLIRLEGQNLIGLPQGAIRRLRGERMAMDLSGADDVAEPSSLYRPADDRGTNIAHGRADARAA